MNRRPLLRDTTKFRACRLGERASPAGEREQVLYEGKTAPYDYVSEVKYCAKSYVPVLYLAIETLTGIESVKIGEGGAFGYDKASGSILLGGMNAQTVTVYNLSGQVVRSVGKAFNSKLNLSNGVYVVKAISADGNVVTRKIQVK